MTNLYIAKNIISRKNVMTTTNTNLSLVDLMLHNFLSSYKI